MAKRLPILSASLSLAIAATSPFAVSAQSLLEAAPPVAQPAAQPAAQPSEAILATRNGPGPQAAVNAGELLVPFEQSAPAYRLTGEDDVARLTFALAPEQAAAGGALAISFRNAVSVLPDTSTLAVTVNGHEAGSFSVASPNGFTRRTLDIAGSLLRPGRNVVEMRARQFHRVDCSLEATYELWSEIDPAASGFRPAGTRGFSGADDLLAVGRGASGTTDIRLILPQTASVDMLNEAVPALQALALFLDRDDISVSVGDAPGRGAGPGIDLMVATDATKAAIADPDAPEAPYGLSVGDGGTPGRAMVSLRAAVAADLQRTLLQTIGGSMKAGLDSGVLAPRPNTIVAQADTAFTLADAGYVSHAFTGRLSRTRFDLAMPADFYPGDYATIGLKLHAATSPGLTRNAQLLVRVNDMIVTSYPFRNTEGEQFDGKLIELPLRAFHPGINAVELLAELPVAADAVCAPEARDDTRPRFILLKETQIVVPPLARIGRLPDLAALAGTAYPYADGKPFDIVIGKPDAQTAGAALTMLTRLSLAARKPLSASIRFGAPDPTSSRNALVLSTGPDATAAGPSATSAMSNPGAGENAPQIDVMETASVEATVADPFAAGYMPAQGDDPDALLDAFHRSTTRPDDTLSWWRRTTNSVSGFARRFSNWLNYQDETAPGALADADVLMSVSQMPSPQSDAVWTVLQAQSPADAATATRRLVDPAVWSRLSGGTASIDVASLSVNAMPATSHFVAEVTDKSPMNLRRLAAAWFSDNFQMYVALVVGLMGIFAVWLGLTVPRKGVRSDQ